MDDVLTGQRPFAFLQGDSIEMMRRLPAPRWEARRPYAS
jgi:hypothetical protein